MTRMTTSKVSSLFAACVLAASSCLAQSKPELDQPIKIKDWGYSIRPLKVWTSIPVKQEEKFVVGHWKPNLDQARQRGDFDSMVAGQYAELTIIRLPPQGAQTPAADGSLANPGPKPPPPSERTGFKDLDKRLNPKSLEEYIEGTYEGAAKRWTRKPLKGSKMPGEIVEFGSGANAVTIGIFQHEGVEWGVFYTSFEEEYRKKWQTIYTESIKSFSVYEKVKDDVAIAARKDPAKLKGDAKRDALKASISGNPGWYAIDKPHYVFLSNSTNRAFVEALAKDVETVRERVYSKLFPPRNEEESISPVRVLEKESEYYQYGGPYGSAGYFSPDSGELVLFTKFEDIGKDKSAQFCRAVMFHEAFHQYVHFAIGDVSPHSWFNEGHGDYFAGMIVNGTNISFQPFSWRTQYLKQHLRDKRDLIPLRSLIRFPQREYYTNGGLKYSQGWALIYFLRNETNNKRWQQILDTYFKHLADNIEAFRKKKKDKEGEGGKPESVPGIPGLKILNFEDQEKVEKILSEAVDRAFDGVDLDALERDFKAWVERL